MIVNVIGKIIGFIFLTIGFWLIKDLSILQNNFLTTVIQGWTGYILFYFGIVLLFSKLLQKNKIIEFIFGEILILPIIGFKYFQYVIAPILTVIMFLSIYYLPSLLYLELEDKLLISDHYSQGVVYVLSLLSVLFFAYKSNNIMRFIMEVFQTKFLKQQLNKYTKASLTRLYTYIIMIVIYILYNFLTFSGVRITFLPSETLYVIKEVFVTFVAVDSLIQIGINKKQDIENPTE